MLKPSTTRGLADRVFGELGGSMGQKQIDLGEVVRAAASLFGRKLHVFLGLSALGAVPMVLLVWLRALVDALSSDGTGAWSGSELVVPALAFLLAAGSSLALCWAHGGAIYFTVRALRGNPPTFLETLRQAFGRIAHVFVATFLANLAATVGLLLLVVPGIILWLMFWVVTPAAVVEGRFASALPRSRALTDGHKWHLLALLALLLLLVLIPFAIAVAGVLAVAAPVVAFALPFLQAVVWVAWGVATATSYYHLRTLAEGEPQPTDLEAA